MSFKPHRDSRPLEQRPLSVQLEAQFHMAIRDKLTKRQQGYVMGAFRHTLAKLSLDEPKQDSPALFEAAIAAILDTSHKGFIEGYEQSMEDSLNPWHPKNSEDAWLSSDCFAACSKMVTTLSGGDKS